MRLVVLVPAAALLAVAQLMPWATVEGTEISQLEAGYGLSWWLATLLVAVAIATDQPSGRTQLMLASVFSVIASAAGYMTLTALRATPTIAAVHYGSDASAGPALPLSIAGLLLLVAGTWLLVAFPRAQS